MRALNNFIKFLGYVGIHALVLLQGYGLSLVYSAMPLCVVMTVMSILPKGVPDFFKHKFFLAYLIISIPLGVVFTVIILFKSFKSFYEARRFVPTEKQIKEAMEKIKAKEKEVEVKKPEENK